MGIDLRDRPFGKSVASRQDLVVKIVFQLVPVQPVLPDVDFRILQYRSSVSPEPVSDFGASDPREKCPDKRE